MAQAQAKAAAKKTAEPAGVADPAELDQNPAAESGDPAELDGAEGAVTAADVAALANNEQEQAEQDKPAERRVFVNEGMRAEIDQKGFTHDPATGRKVTREDLAGVVRGY